MTRARALAATEASPPSTRPSTPTTRTIKLRASVPNEDEKLRPGMFVNVSVVVPDEGGGRRVPATAVVHASYGDSVFVVEDKKDEAGDAVKGPDGKPAKVARQQFVRLGEARGDFVAIVDGVKAGQEVVTAGRLQAAQRRAASSSTTTSSRRPSSPPHPENR